MNWARSAATIANLTRLVPSSSYAPDWSEPGDWDGTSDRDANGKVNATITQRRFQRRHAPLRALHAQALSAGAAQAPAQAPADAPAEASAAPASGSVMVGALEAPPDFPAAPAHGVDDGVARLAVTEGAPGTKELP